MLTPHVAATPGQIRTISSLSAVRSVWADRTLSFFDVESRALIGMEEVESDPDLKPVLPDLLTLYGRAKKARPLRLGSLIRAIRRDGIA